MAFQKLSPQKTSLWPVLSKIDNLPFNGIFSAALAYGEKPSNTAFWDESINELCRLINDGLDVNGQLLAVKVSSVLCDAPARAKVKCVKQFSAHYGCGR